MKILRNIYSWFNDFYSTSLYNYLRGANCDGVLEGSDHFNTIGLVMIVVSLALVALYYYGINHPRFNRWWSWLIVLFSNAIINLFIGFGYVYSKLYNGEISACFTHSQIETTEDGYIHGVSGTEILFDANCWQFGLANAIIAIGFFFIFSILFKWWSRNSKYSPF